MGGQGGIFGRNEMGVQCMFLDGVIIRPNLMGPEKIGEISFEFSRSRGQPIFSGRRPYDRVTQTRECKF